MGVFSFVAKGAARVWQFLQPDNRLATAAVGMTEGLDDYGKIKDEGGNTENVGNAIEHGAGNAITGLLQTFMPENGRLNIFLGWLVNLFMGFLGIGKKIAGMMGYEEKPKSMTENNGQSEENKRTVSQNQRSNNQDQSYNNSGLSAEDRARQVGTNNPALSKASMPSNQDTTIDYTQVPRPNQNNARVVAS